jgi:hypothetical protein
VSLDTSMRPRADCEAHSRAVSAYTVTVTVTVEHVTIEYVNAQQEFLQAESVPLLN